MLNPYTVIDTGIVIGLVILSSLALLRSGHKQKKNRLFALFSMLVAIWIPANHVGNDISSSPELAVSANYLVFSCSFGAMIVMLLFVSHLSGNKRIMSFFRRLLPVLITIAVLSATPLVGAGVEPQGSVYAVEFGPLLPLYGAALLFMIASAFFVIDKGLRQTTGIAHNQLQVIGVALAVSLPLVVTLSFIIPSVTGLFAFTEFGVSPLLLLVAGLYYSVIRHKLFDIRFVVVRSMAYICVLVTLSLVYYGLAYFVSVIIFERRTTEAVSISPINVVLALTLTLIFQPIKKFFDKKTNDLFYREKYRSEDFFAKLSSLLMSTTDIRGLLERASKEIAATFKTEQAFFLLYYYNNTPHHMSAGTDRHSRVPMFDAHTLDAYVEKNNAGIFLTEQLPHDSNIRRLLASYRISLVMPLRNNSSLVGYLFLGEHLSGSYTKRDLKVLSTISNELVIAIQNALSLHEIKEINATLQQRIDVATKELRSSNAQLRHLDEVKDEFMSMASHQLRTPLTSIKGYLSMVLEEDMGKITPQQKAVLNEAFNSSERMVRLIADFLNVSRLQTGKFIIDKNPVDLVSVVRGEVDSLDMIAKSHDMKLDYLTKETELVLQIDEAKVRQVIMNFVDNAIYYSRANSTIKITLDREGDEVAFRVIDTGIGVPVEEQAMLFHKFFRAKNARQQRPDGTGVGLYLARKVITAHGGKMIFSSEEGRGSTFGFRLPITALKAVSQSDNLKD